MKNNLKTKVMLAVLAGGMLCANGAMAASQFVKWYGTTGGGFTSNYSSGLNTGVNSTVSDSTSVDSKGPDQVDDIYGGYAKDDTGNVTGNKVTISLDTNTCSARYIWGGCNGNGDSLTYKSANDNEVVIEKGNFTNASLQIYGGSSSYGDATGNKVTIKGGTFANGFKLYGGSAGSGKSSSGNVLNLSTKIAAKAGVVRHFQEMNFTLPANITEGDKTMLNVGELYFDATKTVINVDASATNLNGGDVITLIKADSIDQTENKWEQGTVKGADGTISLDGNNLIFTIAGGGSGGDTATTKAIAEGIAASLAFVNQGADMVADSGIDGLYVADSENPTIAAFSGNKTRYNTGSHVDIHGWNALAGVALNNKESFSHGVFVEIGNGDIDTYAALNGSGSSDYKGGGYMLRKDMGKGWTIDGAVRAGRVETSWGNDTKGGYEAKQTYYGAHVTFNKMLKEYGEKKLNGYLRYTFTHLGSDSVNLDGTHYGFDSVNSHRTRLGVRMVDEGQNGFELYYGAAWEYGFGGDCDATVNGVTTSGPAVDGSNGVFEVGGTWSDNKWEISAGLEGYVGAKRGVAGGMNFVYKF